MNDVFSEKESLKPIFYAGNSIPINELSSESLENFICAILPLRYDWEIVGYPSNSGDNGFDVTAKRKSDGGLISVQCKRYNSSCNLECLVMRALNIKYGNWKSLPVRFLFFLDGLNEVSEVHLDSVCSEINSLVNNESLSVILTLRDSGLKRPVYLININNVYELLPLNPKQLNEYIFNSELSPEGKDVFKEKYWNLVSNHHYFFSLPLGLVISIKLFESGFNDVFNEESVIEKYIEMRFKRNR